MYYITVKFTNYPKQYLYSCKQKLLTGGIYEIESASKVYGTPVEVLSVATSNPYKEIPLVEILYAKLLRAPARPKLEGVKVFSNAAKGATVVIWPDGTKTSVRCQPGDDFDAEKGVAMCFVKKMFNNRGCYNDWLREVLS